MYCKDLLKLEIRETKQELFDTIKAKARLDLQYSVLNTTSPDTSYFDNKITDLRAHLRALLSK